MDALTDAQFEAVLAAIPDQVHLVDIGRGDSLDENPDALVALMRGDWDGIHASLEHWLSDAEFEGAAYYMREACDAAGVDFDDVRFTEDAQWILDRIYDRNVSDPIADLLSATRAQHGVTVLSETEDYEFFGLSAEGKIDFLGAHTGLNLVKSKHNLDAIAEAEIECCSDVPMVSVLYTLEATDLAGSMDAHQVTIYNPRLLIGNPFTGALWLTDPMHGSFTVKRDEFESEREAFGYAITGDYYGLDAQRMTWWG